MAKTDTDRAYDTSRLNVWFAISSVLLTIGVVWLILDDYTRDWKGFQRQFNRLEYERTQKELEASLSEETRQKLDALRAELAQVDASLKEQHQAVKEAEARVRALDAVHYRADQDYKFAKSTYDAERYEFEELAEKYREEASAHGEGTAAEEPAKVAAARADIEKQAQRLAELGQKVLQVEKEREDARRALREFTSQRAAVEKQIETLRSDGSKLERKLARVEPSLVNSVIRNLPILDMLNPSLTIQQVVLDKMHIDINFSKIPRVDRCATCHLGIDRQGYEDLPQPFTSHPKLDLYLGGNSPHPLESFGCTVCHLGRDRGTSFTGSAHAPRDPEQAAVWAKQHGWHELHHWDTPMLKGQNVQSSCRKCHASQVEVKEAPALRRGVTLIEELGCHGCHKIQGFEKLRKVGPDLTRLAAKLDRDWTLRWVRDPKAFRAHTKMPRFFGLSNTSSPEDVARTDVEIHAIVEYLYHHSQKYEPVRGPARGDPRRGREIIETVGCIGCHRLPDSPEATPDNWHRRSFGPELGGLGSKTRYAWLYSWVKNPKHYWADTRMPSLRLTDAEAADVASYLAEQRNREFDASALPALDTGTLDQLVLDYLSARQPLELAQAELAKMSQPQRKLYIGQKMIQRYGCFGCHAISGFEGALGIGTELTEWGSKPVTRLDFGLEHIEHSREAWLRHKLAQPRIYDRGKVKKPDEKLKMPDFGLSEGQIDDLVTAVLGLTKERLPLEATRNLDLRDQQVEAGRRAIKDQNCKGCHIIDGEGGDFAEWIAAREGRTLEEAKASSAPMLLGEGKKVRPEWLFSFLKEPQPIRPWLRLRMPTFQFDDAEATTLVTHFAAEDREPFPFETREERRLGAADLALARKLASPDYLNCFTCHQQGAIKPQGPPEGWAPDLALAHQRLKSGWIREWLQDPQKLMPGTRMPTYFADENSGPDDILNGDEQKQMQLLTDYIISLGRPPSGGARAGGR